MSARIQFRILTLLCVVMACGVTRAAADEAKPSVPDIANPIPSMAVPESISFGLSYDLDNPAGYLYPSWNSNSVSSYPGVALPDTFLISLSGYTMPTVNTKINDVFGYRPRRGRSHMGLDVKVAVGDTIRAAFDGKVRIATYQKRGYGHYIVIRHPNGLETVYGHLSKKLVAQDQIVHSGDPIGLGGNTGRSTGSHLHFETRLLGNALDPALMFDFVGQQTTGENYLFARDTRAVFYKVKSGDSLSRIASKHGTSVTQLCKLNSISKNSVIRPGQTLRVK